MEKSGKIALARVVMSTRERLLALEPRGKGILAYTLRTDDEVRQPEEVFGGISTAKPVHFNTSKFNDRYEDALKALIADKQKGKKPAKVSAPKDDNVVDLMAALRASLDAKAGRSASKPASKATSKSASKTSKPRARKAG